MVSVYITELEAELAADNERLRGRDTAPKTIYEAYTRVNEIDQQIKALKKERNEICRVGWFTER